MDILMRKRLHLAKSRTYGGERGSLDKMVLESLCLAIPAACSPRMRRSRRPLRRLNALCRDDDVHFRYRR